MPNSKKHRRCYCLLPEEATHEDVQGAALRCGVGGHAHLNFVELYGPVDYPYASRAVQQLGKKYVGEGGLLQRGEVEWLCFPRVLRLRREPEKRKAQRVQLSDLSARIGPFLAEELRRTPKHAWPHVLLADMQGRRMPQDEEIVLP